MSGSSRAALISATRALNRSGINRGTSGNLSVRVEAGMLITPSGIAYESLEVGDLVHVRPDGSFSGSCRPSSEWRIHLDLYQQRPEFGAVCHAHPVHATALACHGRGIPPFHYMVAVAGGHDIPCARYATFGSRALSEAVLEAMQGRSACLMAHHGLVAAGAGPEQALALAVEVETLAEMYLASLELGQPPLLDEAEMASVIEKFRHYGPQVEQPIETEDEDG